MNIDIEVVLNKAFGGFELSQKAKELYCKRKNIQIFKYTWQKVDGKDVYRKWKDGIILFVKKRSLYIFLQL